MNQKYALMKILFGFKYINGKVFKYHEVVGAKSGKETCYMRVECSANTIHGHPISEAEYIKLIK